MKTIFLYRGYVILALIEIKKNIFNENFVTMSEFNGFSRFLQQKFNDNGLDVIIASNNLSKADFNIMGDVIMVSSTCCLNLDFLPTKLLDVLQNMDYITEFLVKLEHDRLETIKEKASFISNPYKRKIKTLE